jgi:hypothetical protein
LIVAQLKNRFSSFRYINQFYHTCTWSHTTLSQQNPIPPKYV